MTWTQWWYFHTFALILGYWLAIYPRGISFGDGLKFLGIGFGIGLLFLLPGKREHNYSFYGHLQAYPFFAFAASAFFLVGAKREELSRRVTEGDMFLLTLSLVYMISPMRLDHKIIGALAILPSIGIVYFAFTRDSLATLDQLYFGVWSLVISAIFCLEQIVPSVVTLIKASQKPALGFDELLDLFATLILAGMTFCICVRRLCRSSNSCETGAKNEKTTIYGCARMRCRFCARACFLRKFRFA